MPKRKVAGPQGRERWECLACGATVPEDASLCPECGVDVSQDVVGPRVPKDGARKTAEATSRPDRYAGVSTVAGILNLLAILSIIAAVVVLLLAARAENEAATIGWIVWFPACGITALLLWAGSGLLKIMMDLANDLREMKTDLHKLVGRDGEASG